MDSLNLQLCSKQISVAVLKHLADRRFLFVTPARILAAEGSLKSEHFSVQAQPFFHLFLKRSDGRPGREYKYCFILLCPYYTHIHGCHYKSVHLKVSFLNSVRRQI